MKRSRKFDGGIKEDGDQLIEEINRIHGEKDPEHNENITNLIGKMKGYNEPILEDEYKMKAISLCIEKGFFKIARVLTNSLVNINIELIKASQNGQIKIVELLLERGDIDVNYKNKNGHTALMLASYYGKTEIVELLLKQKDIEVDAKDKNGNTALIFVSHKIHKEDTNTKRYTEPKTYTEIVELLLKQEKIDINAKGSDGKTALMFAILARNTEIIKLLLKQEKTDINAKNEDGETALMIATKRGYSSEEQCNEIVELLLKQEKIDINAKGGEYGHTALMIAAYEGKTEIVKLLLEREDIDINAKDTAERFIIGENDIQLDVTDNYGKTALMIASEKGNTEIVELLLGRDGIQINATGGVYEQTALMIAVYEGNTEIVKLLLKRPDIDINVKDTRDGDTALHIAVYNRYTEIVKLLLERRDIDINAKDTEEGDTALHIAVYNRYTEIVKLLLEHKDIDIDVETEHGKTALMIASQYGYTEIVKLLQIRLDQEYLYMIENILYDKESREGVEESKEGNILDIEEGNIFEEVFDYLVKK